jgi:hypothetical protein
MSILMIDRTILASLGGLQVEGLCAGIRGTETEWMSTEGLNKFRKNLAGIPVDGKNFPGCHQ